MDGFEDLSTVLSAWMDYYLTRTGDRRGGLVERQSASRASPASGGDL